MTQMATRRLKGCLEDLFVFLMQVWSPFLCHPSLKPPMMLQAEWQEASGHRANLYVSLKKKKKPTTKPHSMLVYSTMNQTLFFLAIKTSVLVAFLLL